MSSVVRKICLLGDGAVGKTSLIRRFVFDKFSDEYLTTFGTKVTKKVLDVNGQRTTMMIWDILGQKKHERMHAAYYKGASGAMVVCDLTRKETFDNMDTWISSFKDVAGDAPILLIGNKCDLGEYHVITQGAMEKKGKKIGANYVLASAKTGVNVEEAFGTMAKSLSEDE